MDDFASQPQPQPSLRVQYPCTINPRFDMGMILEDTFRLLREGFGQFATIFLAIQAPLLLVQLIALPTADQPQGDLGNMGNLLLSAIFFGFLGIFANLNLMIAARHRVVGTPKAFYEVFLYSLVKFPTAVFAGIILAVVVLTGLLALIIPGIVFYIFGCCFLPAIALADRRVFASLIESFELVRGNWWRVFAFQLLMFALLFAISFPSIVVDVLFAPPLFVKLSFYLAINAIGVVVNIANVMLFYNLKAMQQYRAIGL